MKITINTDIITKYNLTIGELSILLILYNKDDITKSIKQLEEKGLIGNKYTNGTIIPTEFFLTTQASEILENIIIDSEITKTTIERVTILAKELKKIFPKGKKEGTNYYWSDAVPLIERRLKLFFKKYGNEYTNEQILEAATSYVSSFNGAYRFMRILKYFIFKEIINANNEIEGTSELVTYIDNKEETDNMKENWTSTLK